MKWLIILNIFFWINSTYGQNLPKSAEKLLRNEFGSAPISISLIDLNDLSNKPNQILGVWRIEQSTELSTFLFLAQGMGRIEPFRFICLLKDDGSILRVNVIEYNSTHGQQVTTKSWLNKLRVDSNDSLVYGKNVDAISGATISAESLIFTLEVVRHFLRTNLK